MIPEPLSPVTTPAEATMLIPTDAAAAGATAVPVVATAASTCSLT